MKLSPAAVEDLLGTMVQDIRESKEDNSKIASLLKQARDGVNKLLDDPDQTT